MEYVDDFGFPSDIRHAWKQMLLAFEKIHNKGTWPLSYVKLSTKYNKPIFKKV